MWDGILALPIIGTLDSARTQVVMENLLQEIVNTGSNIAILDISGVPAVDSLVAQHLIKTVSATRLMGAECIISGIRAEIAQTIVHLGIDLSNIKTKATLASALQLAFSMNKTRSEVPGENHELRTEALTWNMDRIPILKMGPFLLVTIQVDLYDRLALNLENDLISMVSKTNARGVLIDISAVSIVDSFMGRILGNIASMSRIMDAETVVVGMQPAVAITLVELGLTLQGVYTALDVEKGMELLQEKSALTRCRSRTRWKSRMIVLTKDTMQIVREQDVVLFRNRVREFSTKIGMSLINQTKLITAASELVRNMLKYANGGQVNIEIISKNARSGIRLTFIDEGPA